MWLLIVAFLIVDTVGTKVLLTMADDDMYRKFAMPRISMHWWIISNAPNSYWFPRILIEVARTRDRARARELKR